MEENVCFTTIREYRCHTLYLWEKTWLINPCFFFFYPLPPFSLSYRCWCGGDSLIHGSHNMQTPSPVDSRTSKCQSWEWMLRAGDLVCWGWVLDSKEDKNQRAFISQVCLYVYVCVHVCTYVWNVGPSTSGNRMGLLLPVASSPLSKPLCFFPGCLWASAPGEMHFSSDLVLWLKLASMGNPFDIATQHCLQNSHPRTTQLSHTHTKAPNISWCFM